MKRTPATFVVHKGKETFSIEYFIEETEGAFRAAFDARGRTCFGNWRDTALDALEDAQTVYKRAEKLDEDLEKLERWNSGRAKFS